MKRFVIVLVALFFAIAIHAEKYPKRLEKMISQVVDRCDVDPDSFAVDVKLLEKELSGSEDPAIRAILHTVLATAYRSMARSEINRRDRNCRELYDSLRTQHANHIFDDMETLAKTDARDYAPLIELSKDEVYGHNLLMAILQRTYVENRYFLQNASEVIVKAREVFQKNGDRGSDAYLRYCSLTRKSYYGDEERQEYCRALVALHDSVRTLPVARIIQREIDEKRAQISQAKVNIRSSSTVLPDRPFRFQIAGQNAEDVRFEVFHYNGRDKKKGLRSDGKCILTRRYPLSSKEKISEASARFVAQRDTLIDSLSLPAGRYVFRAIIDGDTSVVEQRITSLQLLLFHESKETARAVVVNSQTGHPVPNAAVRFYYNKKNKETFYSLITDKKGEIIFTPKDYCRLVAVRDTTKFDTYLEDATQELSIFRGNIYNLYDNGEQRNSIHGELFTDRRVYRPGQTVHASAVLYSMLGDETHVLTSGKFVYSLELDGTTLKSDTLSPNQFGSLSCDLVLPKDSKLGEFSLSLQSAEEKKQDVYIGTSVRIEEYKRPTYNVEFAKDTITYVPEDSLIAHLSAMTFADVPVQGATVEYKVEYCRQHRYWWMPSDWKTAIIESAETDEKGNLNIGFCPANNEAVVSEISKAQKDERLLVRISATVTDKAGESHETCITYSIKLKPSKTIEAPEKIVRLTVSKEKADVGDKVTVSFTPEHSDAYIFYYVFANGKVIEKKVYENQKSFSRTLKVQKEWGNGAHISVLYVRDGKVMSFSKQISINKPDKTLRLSWNTFRDHLQPGGRETWSLSVLDKEGKPVSGAELIASMYDASLDEIENHKWDFSIPFDTYIRGLVSSNSRRCSFSPLYLSRRVILPDFVEPKYDVLKSYFENVGGGHVFYTMTSRKTMALADVRVRGYGSNDSYESLELDGVALQGKIAGLDMAEESLAAADVESADDVPSTVQPSIRQNFSETAFFYPHITTDAEGNAQWTFTLPECLTTWKFQGFAHTEDVHYGLLTSTAVASKSFMVQPQMPRFVRQGDTAVIPVKVINTDSVRVEGILSPSLSFGHLSPVGREGLPDSVLYKTEIPFSVEAGKTEIYYVTLDSTLFQAQLLPKEGEVPEGRRGSLVFEVLGESSTCSDGERNLLPVLPSREVVTETVPFYIQGEDKKEVDLSALFNKNSETATDRTLEIGYTDNPALDVFRSLRMVQFPRFENAPSYAAALYANIVMQNMYRELGDRLEQFRPLQSDSVATSALVKLRELQLEDGSWSWFRGMDSSPYITLAVAEHLDKLVGYMQRNGIEDRNDIQGMLRRAVAYLDSYEQEDFARRKEHKYSLTPYNFDLRYMQLCKTEENEMLKTYLAEIPKQLKSLDIQELADASLVLCRFGRTADYRKFVDRVKHYLVYKPGFGRYFATDRARYSWQDYRIPTHLAAMRCLDDLSLLPDMQLWLLRQKQTQVWENPLNAIAVADYLLQDKNNLREPQAPCILLDSKAITLDGNKATISDSSQLSTCTSLTINRAQPLPITGEVPEGRRGSSGGAVSWGYARATFTEEASKLDTYSTGELSISRKIIEKTGNKVRVRLSVKADRDMDFVSVTSKIPANYEPVNLTSGYRWDAGSGYYLELHDSETNIFFDHFRRGTTTIDLEYYITRPGIYHSGSAKVQCEYAPEFGGYAPESPLTPEGGQLGVISNF